MPLEDLRQWLEEGCRRPMLGMLWLGACVYERASLSCAPWKEVFLKVKDGDFTLTSLGSSVPFSSGCGWVILE